jgi:hypothetical protein
VYQAFQEAGRTFMSCKPDLIVAKSRVMEFSNGILGHAVVPEDTYDDRILRCFHIFLPLLIGWRVRISRIVSLQS